MILKSVVFGFGLGVGLFALLGKGVGQPMDNPYRTFYPRTLPGHFSDSLAWGTVLDISTVAGGTVEEKLAAAQLTLRQTGGVIFFPAGTYTFGNSIVIRRGIVLRGAEPGVRRARDTSFAPPTRFVFPAYVPSFSGTGTPNLTAFKTISFDTLASNTGLVYLDINRAGINFSLGTRRGNRNFIIFGCRSNNVATPSPDVPSAGQAGWQRFSYRFGRNIGGNVTANCVVSNNRLNDFENNLGYPIQNDSYMQPGYLYDSAGVFKPVNDSAKAVFSYTDHYGISLGRGSAPTFAEPNTAPYLFTQGMEICDNWMLKTMRVGIYAAGLGIKINRNTILDVENKRVFLNPQGTRKNTNNSATFENRGIDMSGWDVEVDSNLVIVYRHNFYGNTYQSVDGEGILTQECCGGTSVNNYRIIGNTLSGTGAYIGLFKMRDIHNVKIIGNNLSNRANILVDADVNLCRTSPAGCYTLNNVLIKDNYNLGSNCQFARGNGISVSGKKGGTNVFVVNNRAIPGGNNGCGTVLDTFAISAPCYVYFNPDTNIPFVNSNIGLRIPQCTDRPVQLQVPVVEALNPDTILVAPGARVSFKIAYRAGNPTKVEFWKGITIVATRPVVAGEDSIEFIAPQAALNTTYFSAKAIDTVTNTYGWTKTVKVITTPTVANRGRLKASVGTIALYPNPANGSVTMLLGPGKAKLVIRDAMGKEVKTLETKGKTEVRVAGWPAGIYTISGSYGDGKRLRATFIKQ